jgi:hypothetical protein
MKAESFVVGCVALAAMAAAHAADPGGSGSAAKSSAVKLEAIPGSAVKRVTLTAKAAERLGIETGKVGEETIIRKQMVGGLIIPPLEKRLEQQPGGGTPGDLARAAPRQAVAAPAPKPGGLF